MDAKYIDHMGSDLTVVNAARVSFATQSEEFKESDKGLVNFLATHSHWTPFAHPQITLRMTAPIPIRTQCFKHKQGFVENEESRRYISSKPEVFMPKEWREVPEGSIKQGSAGTHRDNENLYAAYRNHVGNALSLYETLIAMKVCPEQARFVLPQGTEVSWYWTGSLAAFARFYKQRADPHAQQEIQELARQVGDIIAPLFPISWEELTKDIKNEK
jgi:thymidylate synthase (FAD)